MRLLVLIQGFDVAASRYRILQFLPFLEKYGIESTVMEFPDGLGEHIKLLKLLPDFDCVFMQRKRFHGLYLKLFRMRARRIVFDLDDALMYKNSLSKSPYSRTRERRFAAMMRATDAVIAGNSFLVEKTKPHNQNVTMIPTCIPINRYSLKDYANCDGRVVTLGWIGDHGSIHYLQKLAPILDRLAELYPGKLQLKVICDTFIECSIMPVIETRWSSESEVSELQGIDIGLMPLIDDPWSKGKCGLKILQYFGVGVPAICTPVGVNRDIVIPEHNGYWASNEDDWLKYLGILIEDRDKRRQFGLNGRKTLEDGYTVEANVNKLARNITNEKVV